ncbi:glycosyltransferase family 2 protein [Halobacteriovorax sp. JY17]|uniref:glycosyltransferase family 2 protein n=1 Tax=Halobacteriovorax sp. JY17 TaxID=2014617 RepID=UPI000C57C599|nr:glycosyltransferase family 2 protein [Halobacteriovorax sp. JY17]PIK14704.1 MAG: glycosyltransferase [Halobacteriovorax sp. JY17]
MSKKLISIVTPCYNEELNVAEVYKQVKEVTSKISNYEFEHIFIDNDSTDTTIAILREMARVNHDLKVIINERNFGHVRSPFYGMLQANGDAVILFVCDLQDPPALIKNFISSWENGNPLVVGVKTSSAESWIMYQLRTLYYNLLDKFSDVQQVKNFTGFGLYDRRVMNELRDVNDPYPYLRGLIAELGFKRDIIEYHQPVRKRGITKNNWFTLYDLAILGFVNHSKVPLRLATLIGGVTAALSFLAAIIYFVYKLIYWDKFPLGLAPITIGLFLISSIQLIFLGVIGEYIGVTLTNTKKRPLVIERERINF